MRYGIDWKRTGRRGHCALLPEIRPNSLAAEFLNAYLDEVGNKPMEMWFVAVPREFWRKVWKKVGSACFGWLFYKESVYWYYIVSISINCEVDRMDGAQFAKMLSDKHLFELKMSCIRLPFCTLPLRTTTPILTGMDALHGYSTSGILFSRAILRHCSRRFPDTSLKTRTHITKPTNAWREMLWFPAIRMWLPFCSTSAMRSITACRWMQSRRKLILRYIKLLLRKEKSQKKNGCSGSMFCLLMVQRSLPQSSWKRISETLRMQPFGRLWWNSMRWGCLLQEKQETGCSIVSVGLLTVGHYNEFSFIIMHAA